MLKKNIIWFLLLAIIGVVFMYVHIYVNINLEPIFYGTGKAQWLGYRFPMYFYTLICFVVLYKLYDYVPPLIQKFLDKIGKYSWEIFLMQMIFFALIGNVFNLNIYYYTLFSLIVCILPVYLYKELKAKWL